MASMVIELQRDALDRKVAVSDLLRKSLVVAQKLNLSEFQAWIESELNGYHDGKEVPSYREIRGQIKGWNPYNRWIPLIFQDPKMGESLSKRKSNQTIAELEDLVRGDDGGETFHMPFPLSMQRELSKGFGYETEVSLFASRSSIVGIIDAVRTIILNWSLKLEKEGILGEGLTFTAKEREVAEKSSQNINNFYGPVHSPQIQQGAQQAIQVSVSLDVKSVEDFIQSIRGALDSLNLDQPNAAELKAELTTVETQLKSPKPKSTIIRESLSSMRTILEGAGGGVAAQLLLELGKILM